jgi:hypothetical protein
MPVLTDRRRPGVKRAVTIPASPTKGRRDYRQRPRVSNHRAGRRTSKASRRPTRRPLRFKWNGDYRISNDPNFLFPLTHYCNRVCGTCGRRYGEHINDKCSAEV